MGDLSFLSYFSSPPHLTAVLPFLFVTQPLNLNRQVLRLYHVTFLALVLPTSTTQTRTRNVDSSEIPFRETLLDHCRLYYSCNSHRTRSRSRGGPDAQQWRRGGGGDDSPQPPPVNNTNATEGTFWRPEAGTSWQIVLEYALNDTTPDVSVYDIDLFTNPKSTIDDLHSQGRKVICYFSAGSYEDFRPDADSFDKSDYGKPLDGWPGEWWLNVSSTNVRDIMTTRIELAKTKGCDGVDPDNVDGYDNDTGFDLTKEQAVD